MTRVSAPITPMMRRFWLKAMSACIYSSSHPCLSMMFSTTKERPKASTMVKKARPNCFQRSGQARAPKTRRTLISLI